MSLLDLWEAVFGITTFSKGAGFGKGILFGKMLVRADFRIIGHTEKRTAIGVCPFLKNGLVEAPRGALGKVGDQFRFPVDPL